MFSTEAEPTPVLTLSYRPLEINCSVFDNRNSNRVHSRQYSCKKFRMIQVKRKKNVDENVLNDMTSCGLYKLSLMEQNLIAGYSQFLT